MSDTRQAYETARGIAAAMQIGINFSVMLLQSLVVTGVITKQAALLVLAEAEAHAKQSVPDDLPYRTIVDTAFRQCRELLQRE